MKTKSDIITTTMDGFTPQGRPFIITSRWNAETGKIVSRSFDWLPHGEIGNVGVPMYRDCWYGELYYWLTREGKLPDYIARNCFATFEGGQKFNHPSFSE